MISKLMGLGLLAALWAGALDSARAQDPLNPPIIVDDRPMVAPEPEPLPSPLLPDGPEPWDSRPEMSMAPAIPAPPAEVPLLRMPPPRLLYQRPASMGLREEWSPRPYRLRRPGPGLPSRPPMVYPVVEPHITLEDLPIEPARWPSASYELVYPERGRWVEGHFEEVPYEEIVIGEYVEVTYPAVWRQTESGLELVEPEQTERVPRTRIVISRVWVPGHYENEAVEPLPAPATPLAQPTKPEERPRWPRWIEY